MSEHCGFITRLTNVKPHNNADKLQLCVIFNNQVVIDKEMKEGDLVFYVPSDMQLGKEFCEKNNLLRSQGGYLEDDKRNVKCIKLRGQRSDGLVLPISTLAPFTDISELKQGDRIELLSGVQIVQKYVPKGKVGKSSTYTQQRPQSKDPFKVKYPLFAKHKDTPQLDYNLDLFNMNDEIIITEKCHGCSGRISNNYAYRKKKCNKWRVFWNSLIKKKTENERFRRYITGSKNVILENNKDGDGYYGDNAFRFKYLDDLEQNNKLQFGEEIYFEIVGWVNENTSIMPSCGNSKIQDKEFSKQYGETTVFSYGCEPGENDIYVYRMTFTNEDGYVIEYPWDLVKLRCEQMGLKTVPELDRFMFITIEDLMARVDLLLDRPSTIDSRHVSEGVVVRRNNIPGFASLKKKGYYFKVLEGLIKESAVEPDMEEADAAFVDEVIE